MPAVASDVVIPSPSCPAAIHSPGVGSHAPINGSLSGVAGRNPVQQRITDWFARLGHELHGASEHAPQHGAVDGGIPTHELARRPDQHLSRPARLEIERDRFRRHRVRAREIAKLDELMPADVRRAIRDGEVTFARHDRQLRRELGRARTGRVDDDVRAHRLAGLRPDETGVDRRDPHALAENRSARSRATKQLERCAGRIDDGIRRNAKRPGEPAPQSWLGDLEVACIEDLGRDADSRIRLALCFERGELRRILGDPERAASLDFRSPIRVEAELAPESVGIRGQRELLGRVVHHDDVSHARGRRAGCGERFLEDRHSPTIVARAPRRTRRRRFPRRRRSRQRCAPSSRPHDQPPMPNRNGSAGSNRRVESPVMNARPRMCGINSPSSPGVSHPVNRPPVMLSCRHGCSNASEPRRCSAAITADVPVPHGERSYSPPEHSTKLRASAFGVVRRARQLDVVDRQRRRPDAARRSRSCMARVRREQLVDVRRVELRSHVRDEEPVAAVRDVADDAAASRARRLRRRARAAFAATFSIVTDPSSFNSAETVPTGVSKRATPGDSRPRC